jgi:hypothetical protein
LHFKGVKFHKFNFGGVARNFLKGDPRGQIYRILILRQDQKKNLSFGGGSEPSGYVHANFGCRFKCFVKSTI